MKYFSGFLLFLLFIPGFTGCKKPSYDHYTISDDFRTWVDYNRGSYWIYRNENSGKNDSTSVWQRTFETSEAEKGNGYYFDYIDLKMKSRFLYELYLRGNASFESAAVTTNEADYPEAFRTNVILNQELNWNNGTYQELEPLDTLNVNDRNFLNVRRTRTTAVIAGDSIIREYFFARHTGLIKYRQQYKSTDSSWSLVRWNVSQQ